MRERWIASVRERERERGRWMRKIGPSPCIREEKRREELIKLLQVDRERGLYIGCQAGAVGLGQSVRRRSQSCFFQCRYSWYRVNQTRAGPALDFGHVNNSEFSG